MQSPLFVENVVKNKKLDVGVNVETFQSTCEYAHTSFMTWVSRYDVWKESILHVNCNRHLVPWDPGVLSHNGRLRRLGMNMENENESIRVSKSALEEKRKTVSAYDKRLDGPWNYLDLWHITWGNGLTCFSSLWLFVCLQESIASLERFEHEKGIIFSHNTFTYTQDIKKKGGTLIDYVPENSSLFGVRNHVISEVTLLLQKVTIYGDNSCTTRRFYSLSVCLVWIDLEGKYSDLISTFFELSWYISRAKFDKERWKIVWDTLSTYDPHGFNPNVQLYSC